MNEMSFRDVSTSRVSSDAYDALPTLDQFMRDRWAERRHNRASLRYGLMSKTMDNGHGDHCEPKSIDHALAAGQPAVQQMP
jgi:hypothetical protein